MSDIPAIAAKMIDDMNERHHCAITGMTLELETRLLSYSWPGNVRELRNTIERATILAGKGMIGVEHLPPRFGEAGFAPAASPARQAAQTLIQAQAEVAAAAQEYENAVHVQVGTTVDEAERQLILKTLLSTNNNKTRAAEILGITPKTLQNKLKEYALAASSVAGE